MEDNIKWHFEQELQLRTRQLILSQAVLKDATNQLEAYWRGIRHDMRSPIEQLDKMIDYLEEDKIEQKAQIIAHSRVLVERLKFNFEKISILVDLQLLDENQEREIEFKTMFDACVDKLKDTSKQQAQSIQIDFSGLPVLNYKENFLRSIFYNLVEFSLLSVSKHNPVFWKTSQASSFQRLEITGLLKEKFNLIVDKQAPFNPTNGGAEMNLAIIGELLENRNGQLKLSQDKDLLSIMIQF